VSGDTVVAGETHFGDRVSVGDFVL
jgi:hypothetical protein